VPADDDAAAADGGDESRREWAANRREAAAEHVAALERRKAAESAQAARLVQDFVREATALGLPTKPLRANADNGRTTYRTQLSGWYLKRDRSLAVDVDGNFYVMSAMSSLRGRFTGVHVAPSDPPLIVGVGARDGESMPLQHLLRLRLDAGDDWPG
jgi:hypothetical protein